MKLISVIIPVYNTAEYLHRCLDSVLNNTYRHLEVICIDDGSKDSSAEILQQYAQADSRVVIISQENAGVSAARNAGLDRATGEFIAFIDSDDWVHVRYFEMLLNGILEQNADIAICNNIQTDHWLEDTDISNQIVLFTKCKISSSSTVKSNIERYIWGRIYRRELIDKERFVLGVKLAEDSMFNIALFCSRNDITCAICDEVLYYYFVRWTSASHTLGGSDVKPLIKWYLDRAISQFAAEQNNARYIYEAIKALLSWRYVAILAKNKNELLEIEELMNIALNLLWKSNQILITKRIMYSVMIRMPSLYRWFRLATDPTMFAFEKKIKAEQCVKDIAK